MQATQNVVSECVITQITGMSQRGARPIEAYWFCRIEDLSDVAHSCVGSMAGDDRVNLPREGGAHNLRFWAPLSIYGNTGVCVSR
jgi:hypothetical protein